jgi:hypothetical protein
LPHAAVALLAAPRLSGSEFAVFHKKALLIALFLVFLPVAADAADSYRAIEKRLTSEQMRDTGLDTLSPAQLELLNRLLRDEAPQTTVQRTPAATAPKMSIGLDDAPIRSRIKGTVSGWEPGTEFTLENGQVWKVLKGSLTLRAPVDAPEVLVVPGVAGRWFLQVDEDLPKARVYRID